MYSYEDRIRAVKLFIKLGKRTGLTIRQLGYPTKNSLKNWHLEYERVTICLSAMCARRRGIRMSRRRGPLTTTLPTVAALLQR